MNNFLITYVIGFIIFIIIGFLSRSTKNFYKGTGDYGVFTTSSGLLASFIGGGSIINLIGLANKYGYWAYADVIPSALGLLVAYIFITRDKANKFFYKTEYNQNITLKVHHAVIVLLYTLVMVAQFIGLKKLAAMTGISNTDALILITAALVWMYSIKGYSAVANTDKAQFIIMLLGFYAISFFSFTFLETEAKLQVGDKVAMPLSLILALSLPFFFLPISQEINQRASVAGAESTVKKSLIISGILYFLLGSITILAGIKASSPGLPGVIESMPTPIIGNIVFFAILAALISTTDTALNISTHSLSEVVKINAVKNKQYILSVPIILAVIFFSSKFPTILSVILLALFLYMSGPAYMSLSKIYGLKERTALSVSIIAILLHFAVKLVGYEETTIGLIIIATQFLALISMVRSVKMQGEFNG